MTSDDRRVLQWAARLAKLVRDTDGWSSDIAWAVRRSVEGYVKANFDLTITHLPHRNRRVGERKDPTL